MPRRSRSHGRKSDYSKGSRATVPLGRYAERAQTPPVSYWYPPDDESSRNPTTVVRPLRFFSEPLPFIPSSIPRGQVPRLTSRVLGVQPKARPISLLNALQRAQALPWGSTPCQRRRTRSRVLHALGIAGRKGVGAGKPRRLSLTSHVRCR